MEQKTVADVMGRRVISCELQTPVPEVARIMTHEDVSAVVVLDEEECLAGLISRTDLVVLYGYEEEWPYLRAQQVMISQVRTVQPNEQAVVAAQQLHQQKISRLVVTEPVGNGKQRPVGMLSITDIVREMSFT